MKVINLSEKKYERLKEIKLLDDVLSTESILYDFKYNDENKVIKALSILEGNIFANKLYTLEQLDYNRKYFSEVFCIPDGLVSVNNNIVGLTMPRCDGIALSTLLKNNQIDYKDQIFFLKQVGILLEDLSNIRKNTDLKDIYINDLHESNFIVNLISKKVTVVDLDSCKIESNYPFVARYLTPFSLLNYSKKYKINNEYLNYGYVIADENSDLYCYSIMILSYLYGEYIGNFTLEDFYKYLNYLKMIGLDINLLDILSKIVLECKNENPFEF